MSVNIYDATDGKLKPFVGGTFYAECPIASILPYGGSEPPVGWLLCQGQEVLKTSYADLYTIIGDSFGTASDNTKFVLPDLRESVPKGAGLTSKSSNHMDADGLAVGEFIDDRVQSHIHNIPIDGTGSGTISNYPASGTRQECWWDGTTVSQTGRKGDTTEVKAVGVNYIIKAKQSALPLEFETALDTCVKTSDIQSTPISGNGNPISSGGVYDALNYKADKATTLSGYNISNAYTKDEVDNLFSQHETNISWKSAVATYADIATTYPNPQEGWTVVTTDTNIAWRYSGGEWIEISANTIPNATTQVNGLMTTTMVSKLDGIASGAERPFPRAAADS